MKTLTKLNEENIAEQNALKLEHEELNKTKIFLGEKKEELSERLRTHREETLSIQTVLKEQNDKVHYVSIDNELLISFFKPALDNAG